MKTLISGFWPLLIILSMSILWYRLWYKFNIWASSSSKQDTRIKYITRILLHILSFILVIIGIVFTSTMFNSYLNPANVPSTPTIEELSEKIERISGELSSSSKELLEIQTELENRIETVEALKKEAEIAESVISLTSEQVNAIQAKLNQELAASSGYSTIVSIIINTVFFALGLIAPLIIRFIKKKLVKQQPARRETESGYSKDEIERAIELLKTIERTTKLKK